MVRGPFALLVAGLFVAAVAWLAFGSGSLAGLTENQLGALVQLGLLGLVLTYVGRTYLTGNGVSTTAKSITAWVGIALVLVAGYAFKDELQHVAHRVTLGLVPGSAVTRLTDEGTARVTIGRDRSGHFVVTGEVNDADVTFLVDTGASTIALNARDAERVGIPVDQLSYSIPISTANGIARAAAVQLDSVTIGGIERRDVQATVSERGALSQSLLGMNFLGTLSSFEIRSGERLLLAD